MEATEQQDGAARPGDPAAPDAGAAHDTSDSAAAQVAEDEGAPAHPPSAAPPRPSSAADVARVVRELGEKAAAAGAAAQGSAGGGSEQAAATQGAGGLWSCVIGSLSVWRTETDKLGYRFGSPNRGRALLCCRFPNKAHVSSSSSSSLRLFI